MSQYLANHWPSGGDVACVLTLAFQVLLEGQAVLVPLDGLVLHELVGAHLGQLGVTLTHLHPGDASCGECVRGCFVSVFEGDAVVCRNVAKRALALAPLVLDSVDDEGIENRTVNREIARECAQNGEVIGGVVDDERQTVVPRLTDGAERLG